MNLSDGQKRAMKDRFERKLEKVLVEIDSKLRLLKSDNPHLPKEEIQKQVDDLLFFGLALSEGIERLEQ